ncbi:MAG TPA: hypothetical protein VGL82_09255 [Bryobacteraceae bacterium]
MRYRPIISVGPLLLTTLLLTAGSARAAVTLLLEEPYGTFGGMNPTGHAAVYLSHICAASPTSLRPCKEGEQGVVISRYHRVSHYDWIAIPLLPYLYAVDRPEDVPSSVTPEDVITLRDAWRRAHLEQIAPDNEDGTAPAGDWTQLAGSAYDRTIYAFEIETTATEDEKFIKALNSHPNEQHFNLLFHNCADFVRKAIDFYYPHAVHRSLVADVGVMTPKQAAKSLVSYGKSHRDLQFSVFAIPQVAGAIPRSGPVRGVLESLLKSKRYAFPLASLALLHPYVGGSVAIAVFEGARFDPRRLAESSDASQRPVAIATELERNRVATDQPLD